MYLDMIGWRDPSYKHLIVYPISLSRSGFLGGDLWSLLYEGLGGIEEEKG